LRTRRRLIGSIGDIQLSKLETKACVEAYATPFVTRYGSVILTANRKDPKTATYNNNTLLMVEYGNYNESASGGPMKDTSYS
jgi:hypothetical protein